MQSLTALIRLLVTVLAISLVPSTSTARKQLFSGSHSFNEDETKIEHYHQPRNSELHHYSVNGVANGRDRSESLLSACPSTNVSETKGWGVQSCSIGCAKDQDCLEEQGYMCTCDGPCGLTCNKFGEDKEYCNFPGRIDNGRVLVVGKFGLYDYRNQLKRFSHNQKIIFECDRGFGLSHGPTGKTCRNGLWLPAADNPECLESEGPAFRWIRSARKKRRAIKTGGGTFARTKGGGGGGGERGSGTGRRPNRNKGRRPGEDDDFSFGVQACPSLDHDEFMQVEVIKNGEDVNNTYSIGAVAKISCTPGYWVNINNETVVCEKGKWRPKLPQCSALPCRVPYIIHGTFYVGSKPLFFEELKPHGVRVELRCSKGYMIRGPNKLLCHYGEWNVDDTPECVPAVCKLPILERGLYLNHYKPELIVESGTEVEYTCNENYRKSDPARSTKCDHGEWTPATPECIPNLFLGQRNTSQESHRGRVRKTCGTPPKDNLAITYNEGIPLNFEKNHRFPNGTEVMYRCAIVKPRAKNRWKIICSDGDWVEPPYHVNVTCEGNVTAEDIKKSHDVTKLINSSCVYKKVDKHVVSYYNDQELIDDQLEFPYSTVLTSRCVDIGKFQLKTGRKRKCVSGQWMGLTPRCEGLSQYHDYAVDKSPTILFRFVNGSIAQTVNGELIVYPGTTLHMECLYLRKFGRPSWEVSNTHRRYAEGWTDGIEHRDATLEYRLTIDDATDKDSGLYSCSTPTRHSHMIQIIVKQVDCPYLPLESRDDLNYSTNSTKAGTRIVFDCKNNNVLVGNKEIHCQASGSWSGTLPRCEVVECPDIQTVPAMSPLAFTDITRNGTLRKNETAPPIIKIESRSVGGRVNYSCPQGFAVEGSPEAICQSNGQWSNDMPLCKEVECQPPPEPKNGYVTGKPPYKAGDHALLDCGHGFIMDGQAMISCQDDGKWSRHSTITRCVPACTYPGTTIGVTISSVKFYYPIGETVEYGCADGYQLVGTKVIECLSTAKWSDSIPNCVSMSGDDSRIIINNY